MNTIPHYEVMTNEMKEISTPFFNSLKDEYLACHRQMMRARKAGDVPLPTKNEEGRSVRHGARVVMHEIEIYFSERKMLIEHLLSGSEIFEYRELCKKLESPE